MSVKLWFSKTKADEMVKSGSKQGYSIAATVDKSGGNLSFCQFNLVTYEDQSGPSASEGYNLVANCGDFEVIVDSIGDFYEMVAEELELDCLGIETVADVEARVPNLYKPAP